MPPPLPRVNNCGGFLRVGKILYVIIVVMSFAMSFDNTSPIWVWRKKEIEVGVGNLKGCLKGYIDHIDGYSKGYCQNYFEQHLIINWHILKTKQSPTSFIFCVNFILFHFYINTFHFLLLLIFWILFYKLVFKQFSNSHTTNQHSKNE